MEKRARVIEIVLDFDTKVNKFIEIFRRVACWEHFGWRSNVVNFNSTLLSILFNLMIFIKKNGVRSLSKLWGL